MNHFRCDHWVTITVLVVFDFSYVIIPVYLNFSQSALSVFLELTPTVSSTHGDSFVLFLVYIIECAVLNYGKFDRSSSGTLNNAGAGV